MVYYMQLRQGKIIQKQKMQELSSLFMTHRINVMHALVKFHEYIPYTRGYQKVLSLTWKEPEIWIYSALFFNVVPFQLHTLVPSSYPVINTRSVEVNILVP